MVFHSQTKPVKCSLLPVGTIYSTYSMWHFKKSINFSFEPQNTEEEKKKRVNAKQYENTTAQTKKLTKPFFKLTNRNKQQT